jgi:hypothetical protein
MHGQSGHRLLVVLTSALRPLAELIIGHICLPVPGHCLVLSEQFGIVRELSFPLDQKRLSLCNHPSPVEADESSFPIQGAFGARFGVVSGARRKNRRRVPSGALRQDIEDVCDPANAVARCG